MRRSTPPRRNMATDMMEVKVTNWIPKYISENKSTSDLHTLEKLVKWQ